MSELSMIRETEPPSDECHIATCGGHGDIFTSVSVVWENLEDLSLF